MSREVAPVVCTPYLLIMLHADRVSTQPSICFQLEARFSGGNLNLLRHHAMVFSRPESRSNFGCQPALASLVDLATKREGSLLDTDIVGKSSVCIVGLIFVATISLIAPNVTPNPEPMFTGPLTDDSISATNADATSSECK